MHIVVLGLGERVPGNVHGHDKQQLLHPTLPDQRPAPHACVKPAIHLCYQPFSMTAVPVSCLFRPPAQQYHLVNRSAARRSDIG
ncbi:hypothetical protein CV_3882 [Chromobacterium violaceum ATCC 12472]|uniref:Uncharacterized protein n=1 Tax=Chromobacterium violaceum (strain ATCC 12472 / DSM 30191 / JCM 1249 / CCUG 213 / NBRC 12614 / NCIMB 9131 / NCTC 9757 / MK) TaxID=243365 RepID=Q7NPR0_CHRVO|nr:hypothetical protein CV_3882 [Chromobacterium violaceum ATCC 12472]